MCLKSSKTKESGMFRSKENSLAMLVLSFVCLVLVSECVIFLWGLVFGCLSHNHPNNNRELCSGLSAEQLRYSLLCNLYPISLSWKIIWKNPAS